MHVLYYPALDEVLLTVLQQSKPFNFKTLYIQKTDKKDVSNFNCGQTATCTFLHNHHIRVCKNVSFKNKDRCRDGAVCL